MIQTFSKWLFALLFLLTSFAYASGQTDKEPFDQSDQAIQSSQSNRGEVFKSPRDIDIPIAEIVPADRLASLSGAFRPDDTLSLHVALPENYDPQNPPGLFVYVSPSPSGEPPANWYKTLSQNNFIYISVNDQGNLVQGRLRIITAAFAVEYVEGHYAVNEARSIISGFSGGGRMSTIILETLPGVFEGAVMMGGATLWQGDEAAMAQTLGNGAYVFMTGSEDHARSEVNRSARQYKKAGIKAVKVMNIRGLNHELPRRTDFKKAVEFLSEKLPN